MTTRKIGLFAVLLLVVFSLPVFSSPKPTAVTNVVISGKCSWLWDASSPPAHWRYVDTNFSCSPGWICSPPPYQGGYDGQVEEVDCTEAPILFLPDGVPQPMPSKKE